MNTQSLENLFTAMLETQVESGTAGTISKDRLEQAITTGPELTPEEKQILLKSPVARYEYLDAKNRVFASMNEQLQTQHIETNVLPLAASDQSDKHTFSCSGYRVTLYNKKKYGIPWVILLQLDNSFMKIINPMTIIRLVDSGGLEWLRGKPDINGELTASWLDSDTDLLERSKRFSLNVELV